SAPAHGAHRRPSLIIRACSDASKRRPAPSTRIARETFVVHSRPTDLTLSWWKAGVRGRINALRPNPVRRPSRKLVMMPFRRIAVIAVIIAMMSASIPAPALALNTAQEIQIGKNYDKQITDSTVIVTDP